MDTKEPMYGILSPDIMLEGLLPGYSFLARLFSFYLHTDTSVFLLAFIASFVIFTYAVPVLLTRLYSVLLDLAASVEIRYHDTIYNDVMQWASQVPGLRDARKSIAGTKNNFVSPWEKDEPKTGWQELSMEELQQFDDDPRDFWVKIRQLKRYLPIRYTPAPAGFHFFFHRGYLLGFRRQPYKDAGSPWTDHREKLYLYAWRQSVLRDLLDEIQGIAEKRNDDLIRVNQALKDGMVPQWAGLPSKRPRPLSTVIVEPDIKRAIIADLTDFLQPRTRSWYHERGIPYRRGYLFQGPPGTGKSSLCLAIAGLLSLQIFTVSLNSKTVDGDSLSRLFLSLPDRCIVLLEDVDQAGIANRDLDETRPLTDVTSESPDCGENIDTPETSKRFYGGVTLSDILNIIDGVSAQEGRILIMTTNDPDSIDKALRRPGRVDRIFSFGLATERDIKEQFLTFFVKPSNQSFIVEPQTLNVNCALESASPEWSLDEIIHLSDSFANKVESNKYAAALIQNYLLCYRKDPVSAARNVTLWTSLWHKSVLQKLRPVLPFVWCRKIFDANILPWWTFGRFRNMLQQQLIFIAYSQALSKCGLSPQRLRPLSLHLPSGPRSQQPGSARRRQHAASASDTRQRGPNLPKLSILLRYQHKPTELLWTYRCYDGFHRELLLLKYPLGQQLDSAIYGYWLAGATSNIIPPTNKDLKVVFYKCKERERIKSVAYWSVHKDIDGRPVLQFGNSFRPGASEFSYSIPKLIMDNKSSPYTQEEQFSEREQRILAKYKSQISGDLRRYKSRERTYFDSGDLALSEANRVTDEGTLQTGTAHPSRQTISRPHAPVPEGSNVDNRANEEVLRRSIRMAS
ncbi:P-loop containing nucleoside triphosphate hydrolase protein [Aspergillus japonicus CBS 114.51]|uniref:P-loop containing nucleoside triphosphate hydrolase protein n=1 Tax=Aspergillus japonicus CBS 114.51 TaxID=1448312 RepID=A0A8T8X8P8_ASPJA|nr:P-loop containing nucleoside triphosphate hydrolase protein [Aspergillus japonicus CBS 114.51]RAH84395.1 P-loop containing nucleoside triphosphate hydrolase protein [Aspergillus japonicus CBS 114.51]